MRSFIAGVCALVFVTSARANISITGNGKVTYVPNIAYVHITVASEAKTAAEAWRLNGDIVRKMFAALKEFGMDEKDFKTAGLNLSPRYFHPKDKEPVLLGYTATYDLHLTARQLDKLGGLLDKLVECGANRNMGISFSHDNIEALLAEARLKAVTDGRQRAALYVQAAGGSLGTLLGVSESGGHHLQRELRFEVAPAASSSLPVAGGQQDLNVSVTVTYSINNNLAIRP